MPTYGYLQGQHVTVNMTEAVFDSVESGVRFTMRIVVKNISMKGQRVRIVPPKEAEFTLTVQNDVDLAPGLDMSAELAYYSEAPNDIESTLYVLVGRSDARKAAPGECESLLIPVKATLPAAKLVMDLPVDFGVVTPFQHITKQLVVTNKGSRDGRISITSQPGKFTILPLDATIRPGDSASFKVDLKCDAELGALKVNLPINLQNQMAFFEKPTELPLVALVADPSVELHDAKGAVLAKAEFGRLYCGLEKKLTAYLVNKGPRPLNFTVSKAGDDSGGGGEEDEKEPPLKVFPPMGRILPGVPLPLEFTFAPPKRPPPPRGFIAGEETEDDVIDEITSSINFEILETSQQVPCRMEGTALAPRVGLSNSSFDFKECVMYDHREAVLVLTNKHEMPYQFSFVCPAHFGITKIGDNENPETPYNGKLPPSGQVEVMLTFKPHQVGPLSGTIQLLGFGGKVANQPIRVIGECTAPTKRTPAGGTMMLPEDFYKPPQIVDNTGISFPPQPINAKWHRPPKWEMSETLQGGKVQQGGSEPLEKLKELTKVSRSQTLHHHSTLLPPLSPLFSLTLHTLSPSGEDLPEADALPANVRRDCPDGHRSRAATRRNQGRPGAPAVLQHLPQNAEGGEGGEE